MNKIMRGLGVRVAVLGAAMVIAGAGRTEAQPGPYSYAPQQPNFYKVDTNTPVQMTGAQVTNWAKPYQQVLRQDKGLSVFVAVTTTNALTVSTTNTLDVTADGSVFTTTHPFTLVTPVVSATGTNTYVWWTNIPPSALNNVRGVAVTSTGMGALAPTTNVGVKLTFSWSGQ